jgi:hypothetical protein
VKRAQLVARTIARASSTTKGAATGLVGAVLTGHRGPGIFFYGGVFFFGAFFCHNFAENGPNALKMVQKDASRNSTQSVIKICS